MMKNDFARQNSQTNTHATLRSTTTHASLNMAKKMAKMAILDYSEEDDWKEWNCQNIFSVCGQETQVLKFRKAFDDVDEEYWEVKWNAGEITRIGKRSKTEVVFEITTSGSQLNTRVVEEFMAKFPDLTWSVSYLERDDKFFGYFDSLGSSCHNNYEAARKKYKDLTRELSKIKLDVEEKLLDEDEDTEPKTRLDEEDEEEPKAKTSLVEEEEDEELKDEVEEQEEVRKIQTSFKLDVFNGYHPHVLDKLLKCGTVDEDGLFNWKLSIKDDFQTYITKQDEYFNFYMWFPVPVCTFEADCCCLRKECDDSFSMALKVFKDMDYFVGLQGFSVVSMPLDDYIEIYNRRAQAKNEPTFDVAFNKLGRRWREVYKILMNPASKEFYKL